MSALTSGVLSLVFIAAVFLYLGFVGGWHLVAATACSWIVLSYSEFKLESRLATVCTRGIFGALLGMLMFAVFGCSMSMGALGIGLGAALAAYSRK